MLGILTFLDPPRPDTKETIENAMALGVDVKMITGAFGGAVWVGWLGRGRGGRGRRFAADWGLYSIWQSNNARPLLLHTHALLLTNTPPSPTPTGDHQVIAKETARQLSLGTNIPDAANLPTMDADGKIPKDLGKKYGKMILEADGFAQVYPEHKYLIVEALRQEGFACGMTGDGVNGAWVGCFVWVGG